MKKNENQIPGQLEIDLKEMVAPTVTKPINPTKPKEKHFVPGETLTEEERKQMTLSEIENYEKEKEAAFLKKAKEEHERLQKLRKAQSQEEKTTKELPYEVSDGLDNDIGDEEIPPSSSCKTKQINICRKYNIKRRELRKGIERARELFVPKMFSTEKQKVLLAIIDLLEFGDI